MKWILVLLYDIIICSICIWYQLDPLSDSNLHSSKAILNTSWSIVKYGDINIPNDLMVWNKTIYISYRSFLGK